MTEQKDNELPGLRTEVNIAVFALLINFGYFKPTDLNDFVRIFSTVASGNLTPGAIFTIAMAGLLHLGFLFSIVLGIIFTLLKRDVILFIGSALLCFFGLYVLLLMRAFDAGLSQTIAATTSN